MRAFIGAAALALSCGGPAQAPAITSATPSATRSETALPAGAMRFTVDPSRSVATVRVREQVASVPVPGDAVLTTSAFSGSLVLLADGTFAAGSTVSVALDALRSDSALRDEWIKVNTLETRRFPTAEVTARRLVGTLAPTGRSSVVLESVMRVHGVDRDVAWELTVERDGATVRAAGETRFRFADFGMAVPANRMILSVVDDVRLAVDVVASGSQ